MMRWIVFLSCSFVLLCTVESDTCGSNGQVISFISSPADCEDDYNNTNISQFFGNVSGPCQFFSADFVQVPTNMWTENFNSCINDESSSLNFFTTSGFNLQSAACFKNNSFTNVDCECRMDCLLESMPPGGNPARYLLYVKDIGCNETDLRTSYSVYANGTDVVPSIQLKPEYSNCTQPDFNPSSTIVPFPSSIFSSNIVATNDQSSSTLTAMITPTGTPICADYNIEQFDITKPYCNNCSPNDLKSSFRTSLNNACQISNSSNWYFKPESNESSITFQSFKQCAIESSQGNVNQLFDASDPCSSKEWNITRASCECPYQNGCSVLSSSTPDISNCVLEFILRAPPSITSLVFVSGWNNSERNSLSSYLSSCPVEINIDTNCVAVLPESSSAIVPQSSVPVITEENILQNMYFQVAIGFVGGALILLIISIIMVLCVLAVRRRKHSNYYTTENKIYEGNVSPHTITSDNLSPVNTTSFNWGNKMGGTQQCVVIPQSQYSKWKRIFSRQVVEASQIEVMETIGEGAFGLVQKGKLRGKYDRCIRVAIKAMKDASTPEQVEEFVSESAIMLDFDHPNVLGLLGVCFDTDNGLPLIVLPYMANGDLKAYLQIQRRGTPRGSIPDGLSITLLMRMCLDIAKGMAYLARTKFVHRDLAARNCMVDENLIVRVADFGLSRDVYSKDYYRLERRVKLPVKWLPPESLHDSIFTERTDVWSFGVTCWEVFSLGRTPYPSIDNADVLEYIEKGFRLKKVPLCPKEVYLLLSQCWDESPEIRPCFLIIVQSLKTILSNWEVHDSTLRKQMEVEFRMSLDQDGYESDSQELEGSGSMAARIGSRARYPPRNSVPGRNPHCQRFSSSSSVGMSTINSRTALSTGTARDDSSPTAAATAAVKPPSDFEISLSDNECYGHHDYMNFHPDSQHQHCDCCGSTKSLNECGEVNNRASQPSVPMFEMFYNETSQLSKASPKTNSTGHHPPTVPNDLQFRGRELVISQSSCGTEITNLPDTPMSCKTMDVEPVDYSLPVRSTPQPPHTLSNGVHRREGGLKFSSRSSSKDSATPSVSSHTHDRTVSTSSPTNHFYFTLDPNSNTPSVFDSDTSNSQNSNCDTPKSTTIHKTSCSSEMDNPMFAYQTSKRTSNESLRVRTNFSPTILPAEETSDDETIHGTTPHRHIVLDHSLQKFGCELTP